MRPMTRALTLGLLLATAAPTLAQTWNPVEDFSERINEATNDRLRAYRETRQQLIDGWCQRRLNGLTSLHDTVERYQAQIPEADLANYRRALAQEWAYPCPPGGPPTPPQPPRLPPPFDRTDAYRQWEPVASRIAGDLYDAERQRNLGDCQTRANRLRDAARAIGEIETEVSRQGPEFGKRFGGAQLGLYRSRLEAELARPCPPGAPPPPPQAQVATPPTPPAQGLTKEDADAVARQQASFDSAARERREDGERKAKRAAVFLQALYVSSLIPRTGIGVRRDGAPGAAPERDAGLSSRRVNSFGVSAGFQTKISADFDLRVGGSYTEGRATETFTSPATSATQRVDTGIVYGRLSNGSSGVIAGGGGSGEGKTSLSAAYVYAEAMGYRVEVGTGKVEIGVGVGYEHTETRHDLSFSSSVVSGGSTFTFGQTRTQELREDYLDFSSRIDFQVPFSGTTDGGLTFAGTVKIGPYHRDSSFTGTERDTANFGPVGNRDLTLNFSEKKGGWGGRIAASAALEYELAGGIALTVGGGIDYRSDVGAIVNPNSGDQVFFEGKTTRLETGDRFLWTTGAGIRIPF